MYDRFTMQVVPMPPTNTTLEALFDKVRRLPEVEQDLIADTLADLTDNSIYQLSDDELSVLVPEIEGAQRGEFAGRASVDALLNTPWVKSKAS
jgi:hypothetical protein